MLPALHCYTGYACFLMTTEFSLLAIVPGSPRQGRPFMNPSLLRQLQGLLKTASRQP